MPQSAAEPAKEVPEEECGEDLGMFLQDTLGTPGLTPQPWGQL